MENCLSTRFGGTIKQKMFFVFLVLSIFCLHQECMCLVSAMQNSSPKDIQLSDANYADKPLVYTRLGTVRGIKKAVFTSSVDAFLGIPFAKPPTGPLRFRKPIKVDPWIDILDANKMPNSCEQPILNIFPGFKGETQWNPNTELSEDCLYLNVWVPESNREGKSNSKLDVLVWIYGGSYTGGTITLDMYDGSVLAAINKVIVVSMNYRTGAFGFLFMGTEEAPGNVALHDQALALKWIQENIDAFGGNPNSVTLFGESAGSASISAHILSPISRDLFRHAILQSGTINAPWSLMQPEKSQQMAYKLADLVGCSTSILKNKHDIVKCLRDIPSSAIVDAQDKLYKPVVRFPFVPTMDGDFIPGDPFELIRKGNFKNCSIFVGIVQDEGSFFALYDFLDYLDKDTPSLLTRNQASSIINTTFNTRSSIERELIHFLYTDWEHPWDGTKNRDLINAMIGDYFFACPINIFAHMLSSKDVEVFYYMFGHRTSINPWAKWMGVMHGDEIEYVFGHPLNRDLGFTLEEGHLSSKIMKHFVTFARTGNPSTEEIEWPLYSRSNPVYIEMNTKGYKTSIGPRSDECAFWNDVLPKLKSDKEMSSLCKPQGSTVNTAHVQKTSCMYTGTVMFVITCFIYITILL